MTSPGFDAPPQKTGLNGVIARQFAGVRQFFSDFVKRSALRAELAELDRRGGLDAVLEDIGITRPEMEKIVGGHPISGRLLSAMAKRLGVDIEKLNPRTRYELGRSCALCSTRRRCRHWLDEASVTSTEYEEFCPNAALLDAVRNRAQQI